MASGNRHTRANDPLDVNRRDLSWVSRIREGDKEAFVEMFDFYAPKLSAFVNVHVRSREVAEEIVQDLFLGIWVNRLVWEVPGPLKMYLYRAALNRIANHRRQISRQHFLHSAIQKNDTTLSETNVLAPQYVQLTNRELRNDIESAVTSLPEKCRHVWMLSREHHMTYAEIASLLDISVKTVELHMARAFRTLRERLKHWR